MSSARWDQSKPICGDWVFSNQSNVHIAKDREWCTEYTPFRSYVNAGYSPSASRIPVEGVGTVVIPLRIRRKVHREMRLENVLHCATATCNVLGLPEDMLQDGGVCISKHKITDDKGRVLGAFAENKRLYCLQLSGPPVGPLITRSLFNR